MMIVMDMQSGREIREPQAYDEEVLNASWLPHPEVALQLQEVTQRPRTINMPPPEDIDAFLQAVYRYQE
ncbi:hypothetical protein [Parazoarcus communis]|uniref:Uncharacterized protein n=1 Tax=Parazoarcus communis SWub3 = DSM 12120 TaxID=1121029 RepID=A0A323V421_9RHOO|nr:hypothetical protein [Parazoarcus communis]NMG72189.1 hypothetical protein [Parazoarcus communis SWub3 = DSM 12120]PZA18186.1 hypothetical protein DNK49_01180 [Azoarcus communis] [Parazoarcus communis SWub3 = DSM 12120]